MGTRGAWGFIIDGKKKVTYNHWDSYPTGLGDTLVKDFYDLTCENNPGQLEIFPEIDLTGIRKLVKKLKLVNWENLDTPDKKHAGKVWEEIAGDIKAYLQFGLMYNNLSFMKDSLLCEWAYIFDLDKSLLKIYRGFQKGTKGREYDPVKLIQKYPFNAIPKDWAEETEAKVHEDD